MNLFFSRFAPLSGLVLVACAASPPPKAAEPASLTSAAIDAPALERASVPASNGEGVAECDLVCERAQVVRRADDDADYHAQATEDANRVMSALQPELLACYAKRVAVNPDAHGFVSFDVVIGPDGRVRSVETSGGAVLGRSTMSCMTHRIEKAVFAPPHGGGTLRIHVPFSLRRVAAGEEA